MAEEVTRSLLCDLDGSRDDVETFYIRIEGVEVKVDLCPRHAKPVRAAFDKGARITERAGDLSPVTRAALDKKIRG